MVKSTRQKKILQLIRSKRLATQEDLSLHLERAGIPATQSSISRDLDELGIVKHHGHYVVPSATGTVTAHGLLNLETAGEQLVVAKCASGLASAIAVQIDNEEIPEIVGTVAGDDTIFIAVHDRKGQRQALKRIWQIFEK